MKPEFILQGTYPFKVIDSYNGSFTVMDMESRRVYNISAEDYRSSYNAQEGILRIPYYNPAKRILSLTFPNYNFAHCRVVVYHDENYNFHRVDGPARHVKYFNEKWELMKEDANYFINGHPYINKEKWFEALSVRQKKAAIWNLNEDE